MSPVCSSFTTISLLSPVPPNAAVTLATDDLPVPLVRTPRGTLAPAPVAIAASCRRVSLLNCVLPSVASLVSTAAGQRKLRPFAALQTNVATSLVHRRRRTTDDCKRRRQHQATPSDRHRRLQHSSSFQKDTQPALKPAPNSPTILILSSDGQAALPTSQLHTIKEKQIPPGFTNLIIRCPLPP